MAGSSKSQSSTAKHTCYLGVGGNISNELGTPSQHILQAVTTLKAHPDVYAVEMSSLYRSQAFGVTDQPDFINAVIKCQTRLSPYALLGLCQQLERDAGRVRLRHWGERSLDVDILLYGEIDIHETLLTIPHKGIKQRNFVVIPLLELEPKIVVQGERLDALAISQDWTGLRKLPQAPND